MTSCATHSPDGSTSDVNRPAWPLHRWTSLASQVLPGVVLAVILMWPSLTQGGALAHRDLLVLDRIPFPRSAWWMGPDLGRRLPGFVPMAALSELLGGTLVGRLTLALTILACSIGVARLTGRVLATAEVPPRTGSWFAALAATAALCTPFALTRLSTGHLTTLWALACVPFLLLAADRDRARIGSSEACAAAALLGFVAGLYALVIVLAASPRRSLGVNLRSWAIRNSVWILPGAFLQLQGFTTMSSADHFRPAFADGWQVLGLVLGRGYWDPGAEVLRGHDVLVAGISLAVVALAVLGWRAVPHQWHRVMGTCIVAGFGVPTASVTPGLSWLLARLVSTPVGAPLREPHRLVGLALVPTLVMAVVGLAEVARWSARRHLAATFAVAVGLATGAWLVTTSLPTVHARLTPLRIPAAWSAAAALVEDAGGTVLVLPWSEYVLLEVDRPRVVYHPLADLFGSDTLASSDPAFGRPVNEAADPRASAGAKAADALQRGEPADALLDSVQVRWVAVLKVERAESLDLSRYDHLRRRISSVTLDLYEVTTTRQPTYQRPAPPLLRHASGLTDIPWTWGWIGDTHRSPGGLLVATGTTVFGPALAALAVDVAVVAVMVRARRSRSNHRDQKTRASIP